MLGFFFTIYTHSGWCYFNIILGVGVFAVKSLEQTIKFYHDSHFAAVRDLFFK